MSGQLGADAADAVRAHLMNCTSCSDVLADLVAEDVVQHPESQSPYVPPIALYDAFLRTRTTRFGTLWKSVKDALESTDADVRVWGEARRETVRRGLDAMLPATGLMPTLEGGTSGAVRTHGAVRRPAHEASRVEGARLVAEVVNADSVAVGGTVTFTVDEPPQISNDGRFVMGMSTDTTGYAGEIVICAIDLGDGHRVSFHGIVREDVGTHVHHVTIDDAIGGVAAGVLPRGCVTLFVTSPN